MLSISNNSFTLLPKVNLINNYLVITSRPNDSPSCLRLLHVVYRIKRRPNSTKGSVLLQVTGDAESIKA